MSKDTDKPAANVQAFADFGQFLATHPQGQAIKQAVRDQGVGQVQPQDVEPVAAPPRKRCGP